jgi:hypothetical protein
LTDENASWGLTRGSLKNAKPKTEAIVVAGGFVDPGDVRNRSA